MKFLNYDSPFMVEFRKLVDFVLVGILWMVASIPLFTFGAATTAMYYTLEKKVRTDEGKIWATFWARFRKEFKQATLLWLIGVAITAVIGGIIFLLWRDRLHSLVFALILVVVLFTVGWMQLWYGYLSRFEDTNRVLLANTFRIAAISLPKLVVLDIICVAAVAAAEMLFLYSPPVMFLIPGIYGGLTNAMHRKIFRPYMPEEAAPNEPLPDSEEEAQSAQ